MNVMALLSVQIREDTGVDIIFKKKFYHSLALVNNVLRCLVNRK